MMEWNITDAEIEVVEKLLLPENCHFADDAKEVTILEINRRFCLPRKWKDNGSTCKIKITCGPNAIGKWNWYLCAITHQCCC